MGRARAVVALLAALVASEAQAAPAGAGPASETSPAETLPASETSPAEATPQDPQAASETAARAPADAPASSAAFAEHLAGLGDMEGAVRELRRVALDGASPEAARAAWRAGELLLRTGHADDAALQWEGAAVQFPEHADVFRLSAGLAHYRTRSWRGAARLLATVHAPLDDPAQVALALTESADGRPDAARQVLSAVDDPRWTPLAASFLLDLDRPPPPRRAPALAGGLSAVLPGAGQAYAGLWGEAASALVVNGLLATGTALLLRDRRWAGGAVCGVFAASFWVSNVVAAINGAHRFNHRARRRARERREEAFSPVLQLQEGPELSVDVSPPSR